MPKVTDMMEVRHFPREPLPYFASRMVREANRANKTCQGTFEGVRLTVHPNSLGGEVVMAYRRRRAAQDDTSAWRFSLEIDKQIQALHQLRPTGHIDMDWVRVVLNWIRVVSELDLGSGTDSRADEIFATFMGWGFDPPGAPVWDHREAGAWERCHTIIKMTLYDLKIGGWISPLTRDDVHRWFDEYGDSPTA